MARVVCHFSCGAASAVAACRCGKGFERDLEYGELLGVGHGVSLTQAQRGFPRRKGVCGALTRRVNLLVVMLQLSLLGIRRVTGT